MFKGEVVELNEQLKEAQIKFFMKLRNIQGYNAEIAKLDDYLAEVKGHYEDMEQAFKKVKHWQSTYQKNPMTLPRINTKEMDKTQMMLDKWKSVHPNVKEAINNTKQTYTWIWAEADKILEMYHIPLNEELD